MAVPSPTPEMPRFNPIANGWTPSFREAALQPMLDLPSEDWPPGNDAAPLILEQLNFSINASEGLPTGLNTSNHTTVAPFISLHYPLPFMIVIAVLLLLLTITTIFGNLLVGLALFKFRQLRNVSNYLIGNLALSDFLLATTILPLSAVYECLGYWVFGSVICYFWLCADVLYCTASIWNLCIIAFDRFTATLYPVWYREKRNTKQALIYIGIVWVFSTAICVPPVLGWNDITSSYVFQNETGVHQCILFQTRSYVMYSASGSFYIPFFITTFFYVRIFSVLKKRMQRMRSKHKENRNALKNNQPRTVVVNNLNNAPKKPKQPEIELSQVPGKQSSSGQTDEMSSKSVFGTDSGGENEDNEDEDSSTQLKSDNPLYVSSSEAEVTTKMRNGMKDKHLEKEKETLVILNPHHRFSDSEKDSDRDHIQIVVTDTNTTVLKSDSDMDTANQNVKNTVLTIAPKKIPPSVLVTTTDDGQPPKRKGFLSPFTRGHKEKKDKQRTSQRRKVDQREIRATIRMAIIIACFSGCWLGFFVIYVVNAFCSICNIPRELEAFFFWLGYSNSSMNPVLYAIFNEEFRRAFQKILGCYKPRNRGGMRH